MSGVKPTAARTAADPAPQEIAAVQAAARDWVLMWSMWRRAYTAIARFGSEPIIIDHPDPRVLLQQCRNAELAALRSTR